MMVGSNLTEVQLQQIVDKTIIEADLDKDGMISYEEFQFVSFNVSPLTFFLTTLEQMVDDTELDQKMTIRF